MPHGGDVVGGGGANPPPEDRGIARVVPVLRPSARSGDAQDDAAALDTAEDSRAT